MHFTAKYRHENDKRVKKNPKNINYYFYFYYYKYMYVYFFLSALKKLQLE